MLDRCFVRSRTAELALDLRARGAKVPANSGESFLLNQCDTWWYCEIVIASHLEAQPDPAATLERMARAIAAESGKYDDCYAVHHRILANLVRLGAAPRCAASAPGKVGHQF